MAELNIRRDDFHEVGATQSNQDLQRQRERFSTLSKGAGQAFPVVGLECGDRHRFAPPCSGDARLSDGVANGLLSNWRPFAPRPRSTGGPLRWPPPPNDLRAPSRRSQTMCLRRWGRARKDARYSGPRNSNLEIARILGLEPDRSRLAVEALLESEIIPRSGDVASVASPKDSAFLLAACLSPAADTKTIVSMARRVVSKEFQCDSDSGYSLSAISALFVRPRA